MSMPHLSRRNLLIRGGAGVGLIVGWALWPRRYRVVLNTAPGEHVLGGFVKIGEDGHVTVVVPQVELGHGVFTTLPQIVADELGADWRTIAVETAVPGPLYANTLFADEWREGLGSAMPARIGDIWARDAIAVTGGSTSVRGFEDRLRDAGAMARALLCRAAAARWDADWRACDTANGFVVHGDERMRFGAVAAEAARFDSPAAADRRSGRENRLSGAALPRLDLPAKIDGSVNFAGDVRLPDMVYASITEGPAGDTKVKAADRSAALRVTGMLDLVSTDRWVAAVAINWWAANHALESIRPRFTTVRPVANDREIERALDSAFGEGVRVAKQGDIDALFHGASVITQNYRVGMAPHAAIETATATARIANGRLELWIGTQVTGLAARAAAKAAGLPIEAVTVYPMMVGGSFGARYETEIAGQVAVLADRMKRPVQLIRSRAEEMRRDRFRPPAAARMAARLGPDGRIQGWFAQIAAPSTAHEMQRRMFDGVPAHDALVGARGAGEPAAVAGSVPPYAIPVYAIDHHPAAIGVPTGDWRGRAHGASAFFRECFIDELAHYAGADPFSYRMAMMSDTPRLAQCLSMAAAQGGWQGGVPGSNQGIAGHSMAGSHAAVMAEARIGDGGRVRVDRLVAVVDCGRVINPDVVRAQVIGGLIFGMSAATGAPVRVLRGLAGPERLAALQLPRMADLPDISVELIVSSAAPGGVGEVAVPPVAPAIANALFAATGRRFRQLPLIGAA